MCGRFTHIYTWPELRALMLFEPMPEKPLPRRYNVAPTQQAPVVRAREGGGREALLMRWGLVPSWAKDTQIGSSLINARGETVATKPAFRSAFKRRRCIVPVSGFYEWQSVGHRQPKRPWYITLPGSPIMPFAGLWESWTSPEGELLESFTIVTTTPNELMEPLHDRMPVILPPASWDAWLDPANQNAAALLVPFPSAQMDAERVSTRVNSVKNDEPTLIAPAS